MKKDLKKGIVAIGLAFVMLFQTAPMNLLAVLAEEIQEVFATEENSSHKQEEMVTGGLSDANNVGNGYIINENVHRRTETTKEFLMSDDTIMVQQFVEPVHYLENGEYKEIDNSLVEKTSEDGQAVYVNNANSFKVEFNKNNTDFVGIEEDGYGIKVSYKAKDKKDVKTKIKGGEKKEKENYKNSQYKRPLGNVVPTGEIEYTDIEADTDLIYQIKSNKLSQNIVIRESREEYSYTFELQSSNLQFIQNEDGSISANSTSGKTKFVMHVPSIVDANGTYSNAVTYTLHKINGNAELTITADADWLNKNAKLPVTITPEIESYTHKRLDIVNVYENGETIANADKAYAGKKNGAQKSDVFMSFKLPKVEPYYQLLGVTVNLGYETNGMSLFNSKDLSYSVYVAKSTTDLSAITYSERPKSIQMLNSIQKTAQYSGKADIYESDIINPTIIENDTITIGIQTAAETSEDSYIALSTTSETTSTLSWYEIVTGIKDDYSMESFSIDGATAYVNNATGDLTLTCNLASVNTLSDMPFETSLIYTSNYSELLNEIEVGAEIAPDIKLNYQQYIFLEENVYYFIDADGSISAFYSMGTGIYYSKEKELYYNPSTGIMYDLMDNQMKFVNGRLIEIQSGINPGERIQITYSTTISDQISKVSYYLNGTLPKYEMTFDYNADEDLWKVATNADGEVPYKCILEYDENGYLTSIKNMTGYADDSAQGVQILRFGYNDSRYYLLAEVFNNQKEGMMFGREYEKVVSVMWAKGTSAESTENHIYNETTFYYRGTNTEITYIEEEREIGKKSVAFNNAKEKISEWVEDEKGIVSVSNEINWWRDESISVNEYTEGTISYIQETSPLEFVGIGSEENRAISINSKFEGTAPSSTVYQYAVNFLACGDRHLDFTVQIGEEDAVKINLDYGGKTYISIPCRYYVGSVTIAIQNNSSTAALVIEDMFYSVVDYTKETNEKNSEGIYEITEVTTRLKSGQYVKNNYDTVQRVTETETKDIYSDTAVETTTYTYGTSGVSKGKIIATETKDENENVIERTTHTYGGTWDSYTVVTERILNTYEEGNVTEMLKQKTTIALNISNNSGIISYTDENNVNISEYYSVENGDIRLKTVEYGNIQEMYVYNNLGQVTNMSVKEISTGTEMYYQTDHYENGVYIGSSYGGTQYTYGYDEIGMVTSISQKIGDATASSMLSYSYYSDGVAYGKNQVSQKTYANGQTEVYTYENKSSTVTHINSNGSTLGTYTYNHNEKGTVTSQSYKVNGYTQVSYDYGDVADLEKQTLTISSLQYGLEYTKNYNRYNNRLESSTIFSGAGCSSMLLHSMNYDYNEEGQLSVFEYSCYGAEYTYDQLGRLTNRNADHSTTDVQNENYVYKTYGNGYTTNLLTRIDDQTNENNDRTATYDANGYVTSVSYNGNTYAYTYDALGRLSSEAADGNTATYTYDGYNNVQKTGLTYTNGKLTAVNGAQIIYDDMGNPTTYKGNEFTWEQGRKLASGTLNGNSFAYSYDGNGMRYKKVVNGVKTEYYYDGSQLLMENRNGTRIYYIYGVTGIEGLIYNKNFQGEYYYFDKNTLGDIVAIRDDAGEIIARYEYDAWGNCKVMDANGTVNTSETFIGNINPFRYRGYYYDNETGFYYLQTRYYDPTICRFINADNYELVSQLASSKELNMYAYCRNNPIMYTDATGEGWILALVIIGVGALIGGAINGKKSYDEGNRGWDLVLDIAIGAGAGAAVSGGSLMLWGVGTIAIQSIGGIIGVSSGLAQTAALGTAAFNLGGFIMAALQGIKTPEPVEFPAQPQAPTYYTPITGY